MDLDSCIGTIMKRQKEPKEERHLAQLIRRKMIQRDHGDGKTYKRVKKRSWDEEN